MIACAEKAVIALVVALACLCPPGCSGGGSKCPAGTQNCPCKEGEVCDTGLSCRQGFCVIDGDCPEGTAGCPCGPGGVCGQGLACVDGVCQAVSGPGVKVEDPGVRACDLLIDCGSSGAQAVGFAGTVRGKYVRQETRLALSFTARADAALEGTLAFVLDGQGQAVDPQGLALQKVECWDRLGAKVSEPGLSLE